MSKKMETIYEAAGGFDGLLRLAHAWHARVLEDEVVSHAFSHGFHPQHTERLAAYWAEALVGQQRTPISTVMRRPSCGLTVATGRTRRWTSGQLPVSIRPCKMPGLTATIGSDARCTITLRGQPTPRCLATMAQRMMCRTVCTFLNGRGTDLFPDNRPAPRRPRKFSENCEL